ncbi:hypothetical protein DPM13_16945 [Paracoccus mutanolyticus]|uniref:DUF2188 domain-containing protein n=1 Tax=Paracoccus mutanolyticus TaxID=1499308 RepID=A0ABM6WTR9_9RHOB|nr:DUF2188 domain-containing protein [Paracoccus mutanolyticus]AWX94062.1 hypothetical protein DPM13_16945 [Paracoccus mutanolyticus]
MTKIVYEIVEHDGGWAYKLDDVFSETYPTKDLAVAAANDAAARQEMPGPSETIEYQDSDGKWHQEEASGLDRPEVEVDEDSEDSDPSS